MSAQLVGNNLVITDTDGTKPNLWTISQSGDSIVISDPLETFASAPAGGSLSNGGKTLTISGFSGNIQFFGNGGSDKLTANLTNALGKDVIFDGGAGTNDRIALIGGSFTTITNNYTDAHSGTIVTAGGSGANLLEYLNIDPIDMTGTTANDLVFNLPVTSASDAVLEFAGPGTARLRELSDEFEQTTFADPNNSLTVNRGNSASTMRVDELHDYRTLAFGSAMSPFASILFDAPLSLEANRNLTGFATTINLPDSAATISTSGTGAISLTAGQTIVMGSGSSISSASGAITLTANDGNYDGIAIDSATITSATGEINLSGSGGIYGVTISNSTVQSAGPISITGDQSDPAEFFGTGIDLSFATVHSTGDTVTLTGTSEVAYGLSLGTYIESGLISGESGVTISGTGGLALVSYGVKTVDATISSASGVEMTGNSEDNLSQASVAINLSGGSVTGETGVTLTGTAGSAGYSVGVIASGAISSNSGAVEISGTSDDGYAQSVGVILDAAVISGSTHVNVSGASGVSVYYDEAAVRSYSGTSVDSGGDVTIVGNSIDLQSDSTITAASTVTLRPSAAGHDIDLGGSDSPYILGLSNDELNTISSATLVIGATNSGDITVSSGIALLAATDVQLISGEDVNLAGGGFNTGGGTLVLDPGTVPTYAVHPTFTGTDATASGVGFASALSLNVANATTYDQLTIAGDVILTGVELLLTGPHIPLPGQSFTIVSAANRMGTFAGLLEGATIDLNGVPMTVNYTATGVTLMAVVVAPDNVTITAGNLIIDVGSGRTDNITITVEGANFRITDSNVLNTFTTTIPGSSGSGTNSITVPISALGANGSIFVIAGDGNDALTIDWTGGDFTKPISFDGGAGGIDRLAVKGGGTQSAVYTPSASDSGSGDVTVGGLLVAFVNLEPVDISGMASVTVMSPSNASNTLNLDPGFDSATGTIPAIVVSGITGVTPIEAAHLWNNGLVVLNTSATTGAGTNVITVSSAIALGHNNGNLTLTSNINGSVTVNAGFAVSGTLSVNSPLVSLNADLSAGTITGTAISVFVDDNPSGQIQDGIAVAANAATVNVSAGTFIGLVSITGRTGIHLIGAGNSVMTGSVIVGPNTSPANSGTVEFGAGSSGNVVDGFVVTRSGNTAADWNANGMTFGVWFNGGSANNTLRNSRLTGNRSAIDIRSSSGNVIENNIIDSNRTGVVIFDLANNNTFEANFITNNWTLGVLFNDTSTPATGNTFFNNNISDNWYSQVEDRGTAGTLRNMSGNWFGTTNVTTTATPAGEPDYFALVPSFFPGGTATPPGSPKVISGAGHSSVDVTPYLASGTDTSAAAGFQGDFSSLFVTSVGSQVGSTGRIQEAINLIDDGSLTGANRRVDVLAGAYNEIATINQSLILQGAAGHASIMAPTTGSQQTVLTVNAPDVTIDGMAIQVNQSGATPIAPVGIAAVGPAPGNVADFDGLTIKNTQITSIGSSAANWIGSPSLTVRAAGIVLFDDQIGGVPGVTLTNNLVDITSGSSFFQRGVWLGALNAQITGNTFRGATNDLIFQFASGGASLIDGNTFSGQHRAGGAGLNISDPNGSSPITISNNQFTPSAGDPANGQTGLSVNYNASGATSPIQILTNTFTGDVVGIYLGSQSGTTVNGNTFTPAIGLGAQTALLGDDFWHILVDSAPQSTGIPLGVVNDADIRNNIFNVATGSEGTAIVVANNLAGGVFGTVTIGVNGDNTYATGLRRGVWQTGGNSSISDTISGATTGVLVSGGTLTLSSTNFDGATDNGTDLRLDSTAGTVTIGAGNAFAGDAYYIVNRSTNAFDLSANATTFDGASAGSLSTAQLYGLEDKLIHAIDVSTYGFVRVRTGHVYVTNSSFDSPTTTTPSIQRGVLAAANGDTVHVQSGTYTGNVDASTKSLTLDAGTSPGQITNNGDLTLDGNDTLVIEINGTGPTDFDSFAVNGVMTLGGAVLSASLGFTPTANQVFTIVANDGADSVGGTFFGLPEGSIIPIGGFNFRMSYQGPSGIGNDVTLSLQVDQTDVTDVRIGDDTATRHQRSRIDQLQVTFSHVVDLVNPQTNVAAAFTLTRLESMATIALTVSWSVNNNGTPADPNDDYSIATLTFAPQAGVFGGSLNDGNYELSVHGNQLRDLGGFAIDANGNALPGDTLDVRFYRLFGDFVTSGNYHESSPPTSWRTVDFLDLAVFSNAFGAMVGNPAYDSAFDFDGDGDVDGLDLGQFAGRLGTSLPEIP